MSHPYTKILPANHEIQSTNVCHFLNGCLDVYIQIHSGSMAKSDKLNSSFLLFY